jgi:hypothetical protein
LLMEDTKSHPVEATVNRFCTDRSSSGSPCVCKNQHRENGKPETAGWPEYEAHHILCVAATRATLDGAAQKTVQKVLNHVKWCVNGKKNMIALPRMRHTVQWYIHDGKADRRPPWENLPQHSMDHDVYLIEATAIVKEIWAEIEKEFRAKNCEAIDGEKLSERLDAEAEKLGKKLRKRGLRSGGTHMAWTEEADPSKRRPDGIPWFFPFSMASSAEARLRVFPCKATDFRPRIIEERANRILGR